MNDVYKHIEDLYDAYFNDVYHYLLYFTGSHLEAEDLTQDTFMKVIKSYNHFKHKSSIKTWILTIAKRTAIDHFRKKKMISMLPNSFSNTLTSQVGLPEKEMHESEDWDTIQQALLTLKPDYRNVIIFRGLKVYSIKETAKILNCKESKVKVDYHRAIKLLKQKLHKVEGGMILNEK